jgi:hypothetical protein
MHTQQFRERTACTAQLCFLSLVFCTFFFCKRAKKMKFKKFSRTFSKELLRGHIFASDGENCANFSFASPFPTYAQTFTK